MTREFLNKGTGLLIIEVINSNPNGDPDRESDPRHREGAIGEISPVSIKSKIRTLIENKEGPVWGELSRGLKADRFDILEKKGQDLRALKKMKPEKLIDSFWDVRVFGTSLLEKETGKAPAGSDEVFHQHIHSGPVQFGTGLSVSPVEIIRNTTTIKRGVQEDKDRGMAPLAYRVVQYGVYTMPFFVNPTVAAKTKCSQEDIDLMLDVLPFAYAHTASYIRPFVTIRHAWYIQHKGPLGSCPEWMILGALKPQRKKEFEASSPANSWDEYDVPASLPEDIKSKVKEAKDLAA